MNEPTLEVVVRAKLTRLMVEAIRALPPDEAVKMCVALHEGRDDFEIDHVTGHAAVRVDGRILFQTTLDELIGIDAGGQELQDA
jgi:hypothetical protein